MTAKRLQLALNDHYPFPGFAPQAPAGSPTAICTTLPYVPRRSPGTAVSTNDPARSEAPLQARFPAARAPGHHRLSGRKAAAGLPGPEPPSKVGGRMAALAGCGRGPEPSPPARPRLPCAAPPAPSATAAVGRSRRAPRSGLRRWGKGAGAPS